MSRKRHDIDMGNRSSHISVGPTSKMWDLRCFRLLRLTSAYFTQRVRDNSKLIRTDAFQSQGDCPHNARLGGALRHPALSRGTIGVSGFRLRVTITGASGYFVPHTGAYYRGTYSVLRST